LPHTDGAERGGEGQNGMAAAGLASGAGSKRSSQG